MMGVRDAVTDVLSPFGLADPDDRPTLPEGHAGFDPFAILNVRRRRLAVIAVNEHGPIATGTLAELLAEVRHGPGYDSTQRQAEYVGLYQTHGEKLDDSGVLDFVDQRHFEPTELTPVVADYILDGYDRFDTDDDWMVEEVLAADV